jgi:hypothetical protein
MKLCGKNECSVFIRTTEQLALGQLSPTYASGMFRNHNVTDLVRLLTADPHQRFSLLKKICNNDFLRECVMDKNHLNVRFIEYISIWIF